MKTLILYYSHTGNNRFLAHKIAEALDADIEAIRPRLDIFGLLLFFSWIRLSFGIRKTEHDPAAYDRVILCGPIWTGQLISPIRDAIRKYRKVVREFVFVSCCGSTDEMKDDPFGYARIFAKARSLAEDRFGACLAFPVVYILPEDQRGNEEEVLKLRLTEETFRGALKDRFEQMVGALSDLEVEVSG